MTGKHIDKATGRVKEAAGGRTGHRRLKNDGRVMRANSIKPWEVTMLTILLIIVVVLLLAGGFGYSRRGRRGV
jgi:hypothetical protein